MSLDPPWGAAGRWAGSCLWGEETQWCLGDFSAAYFFTLGPPASPLSPSLLCCPRPWVFSIQYKQGVPSGNKCSVSRPSLPLSLIHITRPGAYAPMLLLLNVLAHDFSTFLAPSLLLSTFLVIPPPLKPSTHLSPPLLLLVSHVFQSNDIHIRPSPA